MLGAFLVFILSNPSTSQSGDVTEVHLVQQEGNSEQPFAFDPMEIMVEPGTTVRWTNDEDVFHTVTSSATEEQRRDDKKWPNHSFSSRGDTFEWTFDEAGTYPYFCQPHSPFMFGTVTVTAGAGGADGQDSPAPGLVLLLVGVAGVAIMAGGRRR